jgi:hypothetical protein
LAGLRGPYKLPERKRKMQDIYKLIIDGYSYNKIMQQLQISERTFYRYLQVIFANDRRLLAENVTDDEFLNQMAICKDRLLKQRRDLLEMIKDHEVDNDTKIKAHHLAAEIAAAVFRIFESGPGLLSQRHAFPRTSLTGPGTTGVKLVLKKEEQKEEGEEYNELDYEEEVREDHHSTISLAGIGRTGSTTTTTLSTREEKEQEERWR